MRIFSEYSHNDGQAFLSRKKIYDEVLNIFYLPGMGMARGAAVQINEHTKKNLAKKGWVLDPTVHPDYNLNINAMKHEVGLTIQTGNITRAFYDLLKFQAMFVHNGIKAGVLVVPTNGAARALGSNIANYSRVTNEVRLFQETITLPLMILGFDE